MSVGGMMSEFERAKRRYASGSRTYSPLEAEALRIVESLERDALAAVYAENESGGKARGIVANTAQVLGVDIDEGDGHRWDLEHMVRVVEGARKLRDELENLRMTTAEDKRHMDRQATEITALRREHAKAMGDAGYWRRTALTEAAEADGADTLRATVIRQANEITALKGERA